MSCSGIWGVWHYQELLTTAIRKFSDKYGEGRVRKIAEEILEKYSELKSGCHSLIETKGEILKRIEFKLKKKFGAKYG